MSRVKYPFKCDTCKKGVVLVTSDADMIFQRFKGIEKYRAYMRGYGNMDKELRYTLFSAELDRVISYMQERCNAFAKRLKPERIEIYIFKNKIDFDHINRDIYHWGYTPTYRED